MIQSNRGGQVTYHGPGQLVVYLLVDLRRQNLGVRALVDIIEQSIVATLAGYGILAQADPKAPGVYIEHRKIAALGVDPAFDAPGGLAKPHPEPPARQVWLLQRSPGKPGARLGKTTGWIHRATLKAKGVKMLGGVEYLGVDDAGLHIRVDGGEQVLAVDNVVVCAGQEPRRELFEVLAAQGRKAHLIGGADVAAELDAKRAIAQGSRLAASL